MILEHTAYLEIIAESGHVRLHSFPSTVQKEMALKNVAFTFQQTPKNAINFKTNRIISHTNQFFK